MRTLKTTWKTPSVSGEMPLRTGSKSLRVQCNIHTNRKYGAPVAVDLTDECPICQGKRHVTWTGLLGDSGSSFSEFLTALVPCAKCNFKGAKCTKGNQCPCRQYEEYFLSDRATRGFKIWKKRFPNAYEDNK